MMKKIEEITFSDDLLVEYNDEIENINHMCEELDNDKSFQKLYKKYLKTKKKREFTYNKFSENLNYKKEIPSNNLKMSVANKGDYVIDVQFEERFG